MNDLLSAYVPWNAAESPLFTSPRQPETLLTLKNDPDGSAPMVEIAIGSGLISGTFCAPVIVKLHPIADLIAAEIPDMDITTSEAIGSVIVIVHGPVDVTVKVPRDACLHVLKAIAVADPPPTAFSI